jgi:hypothetical protein
MAGLKPLGLGFYSGVVPKVYFSVILNEVKNLKALLFRFFASLRMTTVLLLRQPLINVLLCGIINSAQAVGGCGFTHIAHGLNRGLWSCYHEFFNAGRKAIAS